MLSTLETTFPHQLRVRFALRAIVTKNRGVVVWNLTKRMQELVQNNCGSDLRPVQSLKAAPLT